MNNDKSTPWLFRFFIRFLFFKKEMIKSWSKELYKKNDRRYQKTFFCLLYFPCHMLRNNTPIQCNWCGQKVNEIVFYNLFRIAYPPMQKKIRSLVVSLTYLTQPLFSFLEMDHKFQLPRTKDNEFTVISKLKSVLVFA